MPPVAIADGFDKGTGMRLSWIGTDLPKTAMHDGGGIPSRKRRHVSWVGRFAQTEMSVPLINTHQEEMSVSFASMNVKSVFSWNGDSF